MRKGITFILVTSPMLLLALILGAVLAGQGRPSPEYQTAMEALQLETAAQMRVIQVGFWGGLAAVAVLGAGGIVAGLVLAVWHRSRLIHPHANGLFPVVRGRVGRETYYHDPNRQPAGTVFYGPSRPEGAAIRHDEAQLQVTTQAQAVQLVAAAGQGRGLTAQSRQLVERVALSGASHSVPRLPQVTVLSEAIPEDRYLLKALRADWEDTESERVP